MASSTTLVSSAQASSSSTARVYKYDVFLSFRGPDTRRGVVSQLYDRLQKNGVIKTFMDDRDLEVGDPITATLLEAIEESRLAIVVLSPNYASSPWCLEELAKICECMEEDNRILPLFYTVEPSDARHGKKSFEEAFKKHESSGRYTSDKVQLWKEALKKVTSFSGWDTNNIKTDGELVEKIVDFVCKIIQPSDIESTEDFQAYGATKKAMDEVMEALRDGDVTAVAVQGMGGVGKTTMVKEAGTQSRKIGLFHLVIMGVVSQRLDLTKIQDALAEALGIEIKEKAERRRAAKLKTEIMRKEKILIILDDVWKRIKLADIGIPSYEELRMRNSKVVLTTRRRHVSSEMGCKRMITLGVLSKDDSWSLFVRNAGMSLEPTRFEKVARRVAGECKGLPLALIALARALRDKDLDEWEKAAQRLENSQSANPDHEEDDENAFRCIRMSYDYLKDEDHKSCFLLCCLYPEDHEIEIEDLFRYVVGTRFFQDAETMEVARDTFATVIKHLKDSSLLLDGWRNGWVKMHDVIRDTAIHITSVDRRFWVKAGFGLECWPHRPHQGCTAISLMRNKISKLPKEELVCPRLQILLLNQNAALNEIPESFIKRLGDLRVLDVSNTRISKLPQSFSLLTNLQALYLDDCKELIDISIVGKLKKLEILTVRKCRLEELPREIGHLTNLRILDITNYMVVTIPCQVISKLHKLEELYLGVFGFERLGSEAEGRGEETKIGFSEIASLLNLKRLHVKIPHHKYIPNDVEAKPDWDYFSIIIGVGFMGGKFERHDSRSLILCGETISMLPNWFINAVANKIEELKYHDFGGSLIKEYDRRRLHELKHLHVFGKKGKYGDESDDDTTERIQELMDTTDRVQKGPVFEKLEYLFLRSLYHLEELCVGDLPPGSLVNLKVLQISCCAVKNVSKFVQILPNLEKIKLEDMTKLKFVFGCEGCELKESKLREVSLRDLYSMKSICSGPAPRVMFQSIKIMTIFGCGLLQSLFASDVAQCLSQLEDLRVESCGSLERVIEEVKKEKTALPKLKKLFLAKLPKLYGASKLFSVGATDKHKSSRRRVKVNRSKNRKKELPKLDGASSSTIDIECPPLEHIQVEEVRTQLEELCVIEEVNKEKTEPLKNLVLKELPKLDGASSSTVDIECPSLEHVVVLDCPQFPFSISFSDFLKSSKSGNGFSASAASDYFGSINPVQLNDIHTYRFWDLI